MNKYIIIKWLISLLFLLLLSCTISTNRTNILLPIEIGKVVTTEQAIQLCKQYNLNDIIKRIEINPDNYKSWVFDGCSMTIDEWLNITGIQSEKITQKCLIHDLKYAYGIPGDEIARLDADICFYNDLVDIGVKPRIASIFYKAVRMGGGESGNFDFSWAYASKK